MKSSFVFFLLFISIVFGMMLPHAALAVNIPLVGDQAPSVVVYDMSGAKINLPDNFSGKAVILHFWTEGCSSCAGSMQLYKNIFVQYKDKGLVVIAVNVGQSKEAVSAFLKKMNLNYPVAIDPDSVVSKKYGVPGLPTTFYLDRKSRIRYRIVGETTPKVLSNIIKRIL